MQTQFTIPTFGDTRLPAHFWAKVLVGSGPTLRPDLGPCWEWRMPISSNGYSHYWVRTRYILGHRLTYETLIGHIPPGLEPDHLCRKRICVNPAHIELVTHQENIRRGKAATRKTHCFRGHPFDEVNTHIKTDGYRECRTCRRAWARVYWR